MINRKNWTMVKAYIKYRAEVHQVSQKTIEHDESRLRHLLLWADDTPFSKIADKRPTFPDYLATARLDRKEKPLSVSYSTKVVRTARCFFSWLKEYRRGYGSIPPAWVEALRPPRKATRQRPVKPVPMDEIYALAQAPAEQLWEKRIRAAAILLFLAGLRVSALVSLPLNAINLQARTIKQWPSLGVRTKFGKHATTYLLNIPKLMEVVIEWDGLVRAALPEDGYWFAPLLSETGEIDPEATTIGRHRHVFVRKDLTRWLQKVGLSYRSPHQFRHSHAVYALQRARDVADLKAVSMNLMHSSVSVTDGVYGVFTARDVSQRIGALGKEAAGKEIPEFDELTNRLARLEELLVEQVEANRLATPVVEPADRPAKFRRLGVVQKPVQRPN